MLRIGVDAGGTFTDFVVLRDDGSLISFKLRSNPQAPASVILAGVARAAGEHPAAVVHGSTVGTNALLERKGARTALVTTAGFEDLLAIGRQNRPELYNLTPAPRVPLVPREHAFGVPERAYYDGTIALRPSASDLAGLKARLARARIESIAICFLHSYQTPENEREVADALAGLGYVCASHEISPEFREYERTSTTVINAYIGPLMDRYLAELERGMRHELSILQSNGGFLSAAEARRHAVRTVLSGPAGGVVGAVETGRLSGVTHVLGFDMGGTSTDVSLSDGAPRETTEASIDGMPVRVPMLDIHTVGAGGGSIARVDAGGLLRVGPESAGADPGPACYGSGTDATVTDAHVVLGRIAATQLVGGQMELSIERAEAAIDRIAQRLALDRIAAAAGVIRVANAHMERAIRLVSVERGHDPRDFALVAFGGCGGLHACEIAEELGIATVIVPEHAGALSALGMLLAGNVRDYAAGALGRADIEAQFRRLEERAAVELPGADVSRTADLRYSGQSYEINVPWSRHDVTEAFHGAHHRQYGYSDPGRPVEIVTLRVRARRSVVKPDLRSRLVRSASGSETRPVFTNGRWTHAAVLRREQAGTPRSGPALVVDYGSTTLAPEGWQLRLDTSGNLLINRR